MFKNSQTDGAWTDKEKIEQALKRYNNITLGLRYGGYGEDYKLAQAALEAWKRIKGQIEQPRLL